MGIVYRPNLYAELRMVDVELYHPLSLAVFWPFLQWETRVPLPGRTLIRWRCVSYSQNVVLLMVEDWRGSGPLISSSCKEEEKPPAHPSLQPKIRKQPASLQGLVTCGWYSVPLSPMPTTISRSETARIHHRDQDGGGGRDGGDGSGVAGSKG